MVAAGVLAAVVDMSMDEWSVDALSVMTGLSPEPEPPLLPPHAARVAAAMAAAAMSLIDVLMCVLHIVVR